jgi:hypothetical protein
MYLSLTYHFYVAKIFLDFLDFTKTIAQTCLKMPLVPMNHDHTPSGPTENPARKKASPRGAPQPRSPGQTLFTITKSKHWL